MQDLKRAILNDTMEINDKIDFIETFDTNIQSINLPSDGIYGSVQDNEKYAIDITSAVNALNELNQELKTICPNLEMKLNYLSEQKGILSIFSKHKNKLTLCLYNQGNCVSSIMCNFLNTTPYSEVDKDDPSYVEPIPNTIEISSKTHPSLYQRNFNKLLRSVMIIISKLITINGKNIESILSEAINPISAWLLINYYSTEYDKMFEKYLALMKIKGKNSEITQDLLKEYLMNSNIEIIIKLNEDNINRARMEFNTLMQEMSDKKKIKCSGIEEVWNSRIIVNSYDE